MYRESDFSDARDLYGKSKFLGETDETETAALTLRTSIIGRELGETSHGLLEWFLAQEGKRVKGFSQAIYSGFTTHELARIIALVIRKHPALSGLYQVASQPISKFDLLQLIRDCYRLNIEIARDDEFACDRSLVMDRFQQATGYTSPDWTRLIADMRADETPYEAWKHPAGEKSEQCGAACGDQ
jgi:dTDP-4-dehydrorhamnose reductase